jgi:hypothetical protein
VGTGGRVDAVALERRGREGKKREGEKMGVPSVEVPRGAGVPWGLAPTGGCRPAAARARRSPVTCAARACRPDGAGREGADRWAAA